MTKSKKVTALRDEANLGIGDWSGSLIKGEEYEVPADVAESLIDAGIVE